MARLPDCSVYRLQCCRSLYNYRIRRLFSSDN